MSSIFIIQLIISFFVGGGFIAFLTFLAERSSSRVSGIIISFPSTVFLGFFFLAWTQTPEEVATLIPATLIPLGITVLFPVFYVYIANLGAKFISKRFPLILFTLCLSVIIWLLLSFPSVFYRISNLYYGITGYLILTGISYFFLNRRKGENPPSHSYSIWQISGRAVFVGFLVALVVFLGEVANPFWGGVLAMFPAALSSSMMVIHWYYGPKSLFPMLRKVPLGSLSIFIYAITVMIVFPHTGYIWGTLIAFVTSLFTSFLLSGFPGINKKHHIR
ncbi:MAG: hypothetical protein HQ565_00835 [Bacteroidetes bacterium]|nr:hypothetical protein [Bacteroidota bacterium]